MSKMSALKEQVREIIEETRTKIDSVKDTSLGICATCKNSEGCVYLRSAKEAIYQCEEFDSREPETAKKREYGYSQATSVATSAEVNHLKGLCRNCARNATCKLQKPESGIWHCEEYE